MKLNNLRFLLVLCLLIGLTSILPAQTVIKVAAGVDAISAAYATAAKGSIIELTTSGGDYIESNDITITKDITIRAAAGLAAKPIIYGAGANTFYVTNGGLNVSGIAFDDNLHGNALAAYFITVKADTILTSTNFNLRVDNCAFYRCAQRPIYTSDGTMHALDSLLVTNSIFIDNVKSAIYEKGTRNSSPRGTQPGGCKYLKFENCLVVGTSIGTSDAWSTYIEPANRDSASYTYPKVFINHITTDSSSYGAINTYTTPAAVIQNCICTNLKDTSKYAYGAETGRFAGAIPATIKNCLYDSPHFVTYGSSAFAKYPDTSKIIQGKPVFTNVAILDYSLKAGSPGKGAGTDGRDLGYIPGGLVTNVESTPGPVPESFQLSQNYPNPFNPATTIQFSISKAGKYSINVFNVLGQKVANLFDRAVAPGNYSVRFDAAHLSSGMYIYTLTGDGVNISKKMALLK